jgi:hypothetical protein
MRQYIASLSFLSCLFAFFTPPSDVRAEESKKELCQREYLIKKQNALASAKKNTQDASQQERQARSLLRDKDEHVVSAAQCRKNKVSEDVCKKFDELVEKTTEAYNLARDNAIRYRHNASLDEQIAIQNQELADLCQ